MSNSLRDLFPEPQTDIREAETQAKSSAEKSGQSLGRARESLAELKQLLLRLAQQNAAFKNLSSRLSSMTLSTATEVVRTGAQGKSFMPIVEQLADAAERSAFAQRELESCIRTAASTVQTIMSMAAESHVELERLVPALNSLAETAKTTNNNASRGPLTVVLQSATRTEDGAAPKSPPAVVRDPIKESWPQLSRRPPPLKN